MRSYKDYEIVVIYRDAPFHEHVEVCATDYQDAVSQSWFKILTTNHKRVAGHKAHTIHTCQHKKGVVV